MVYIEIFLGFMCGALWMYLSIVCMIAKRYKVQLSDANEVLTELIKREEKK